MFVYLEVDVYYSEKETETLVSQAVDYENEALLLSFTHSQQKDYFRNFYFVYYLHNGLFQYTQNS